MGHSPRRLPAPDTLADQLLTLTAVCGEFPAAQLSRLNGGPAYLKNVVKALKGAGLLKTYYRDSTRGYRLTAAAKRLMLERQPDRLRPYLTGRSEPNTLKSELPRRLRLHRMAEVLVTMRLAGIPALRWEKPPLFQAAPSAHWDHPLPLYYSSRELKELEPLGMKIKNSRATGILLTDGGIVLVYNTADARMKWEYKSELRLKALLQTELCRGQWGGQTVGTEISALVFGSGMEQVIPILDGSKGAGHSYYVLDGDLDHFYFLPSDHRGEVLLWLLCDSACRADLDDILRQDLAPPTPACPADHDASTWDGLPVLFAYLCDMPRIRKFDTALELRGMGGALICFDFQAPALRQVCGPRITLQSIDFDAYERSVFHHP